MAQSRVKAADLAVFNTAGLTANYEPINPGGLPGACFKIRITNDSNADITISFNGVDDNEISIATTIIELDFQNNAQPNSNLALLPKGTQVFIKGGAGVGNIYMAAYYV